MTDRGFTLVELLVATALTLIVVALALAILVPARASFDRDGAGADLAQRLRTGLQTLDHDVRGAGAGAAIAEDIRLPDSVPVIAPFESLDEASPGGVFQALRVITVPMAAAQGRLRESTLGPTGPLKLGPAPRCSGAGPACGFQGGDRAIVFDGTGTYDLVEIESVDPVDVSVTPASPMAGRYRANAVVALVVVSTFGALSDGAGGQRLVKVTAAGASMPVVDHLVDFSIDVYGAATPPELGPNGWPSYGPGPPPVGEDDERDPWGSGENCVASVDADGTRVPRLARLGVPRELVVLTPAMLGDGPWCGGGGPFDFDADLLRIRRVDLRLRVEVPSAMLRGPAGYLFRRAGHGARPGAWVPDGEFRLSIAPRNLAR